MKDSLPLLTKEIVACGRCPRLVAWREATAADPPARYRGEKYWAKPIPGFGDPRAQLIVFGLAPAAHGGNRTGRIFTGDRSGDWLFRALHKGGFANQAESTNKRDGLALQNCYVLALVRCAPPDNKPSTEERNTCQRYAERELELLTHARVLLALGSFAWDGVLRATNQMSFTTKPKPKFAHGAEASVGPYTLLGSYHPSQQNTFTGKLTEPMLDAVIARARTLIR